MKTREVFNAKTTRLCVMDALQWLASVDAEGLNEDFFYAEKEFMLAGPDGPSPVSELKEAVKLAVENLNKITG